MSHTHIAVLLILLSNACIAQEKASEQRLDEIVQRGKHVMPFDLTQTTHIFSKTDNGGIQQVVVKNPANTEQIKLIRQHLSEITEDFKQRHFSGPTKIHGADMPGLKILQQTPTNQLDIIYQELPLGAQIIYSSNHSAVITAIHHFFDAQLTDHARHAIDGNSIHQQHHQGSSGHH